MRLADNGARLAAPLSVDGNRAVVSLAATPTAHASRRATEFSLAVAGRAPDAAALAHLFALASAERAVPRPARDRASLTEPEVAAVDAAARAANVALPPGWAFDGSTYASFEGHRTKLRPDIDALLAAHLAKLNAAIARENAAIVV